MISSRSRYQDVRRFISPAPDVREEAPFPGTRPRAIETPQGVLEHVLEAGDRLDLLALNYYNDSSKWWLILDANPEITYAGDVDLGKHVGEVIVIPRDQQSAGRRQ
ncbi:MAG: hypothetical protein MJE77_02185 [Proteobacteria bacterium]|nr:hypothetical protein [Pseudomonadota bacterium]